MPPQSRTVYDLEEPALDEPYQGPTKAKKKKTVQIQPSSNKTYPVQHIDDMAESEIVTIWYDRCDFDLMKQSFVPIIKKMMRGAKIEETDAETTRGLEYRTRDGALRRQHNKIHSIHAVLDEQERQVALGISDVNQLSEVYIGASQHCASAARELGEKDQEFVRGEVGSLSQSNHGFGKSKKGSAIRKMFRQVRRTSLTWKSNLSLSEAKAEVAPAAA